VTIAVRDLLAVPGLEVDVEQLFCRRKDLLGLRRHRLLGETMRILTFVERMVTALSQLLVTVADGGSCDWTGNIVVPVRSI
jgi:hypothetical protein